MKVTVCAVGKLGNRSEERTLTDDYYGRLAQTGRPLGWRFDKEIEVDDRKSQGMAAEADLLRKSIPKGSRIITLDERGSIVTSPAFAKQLSSWADQGEDLCFIIGGADGIDPLLRAEADASFSFGKMVWPHKLVRVMLAEQLYRAATIIAGGPYHRS